MSQRIKIGVLGAGHMHIERVNTLLKFSDVFEITGIAEDDPAIKSDALKKNVLRDLKWMDSEELLAAPGLQAVLVETEEHALVPAALRCIRAGKHIALDKPAGESLKAFREVLDEAEKRKLAVQVGYMYRYNEAVRYCVNAVREGLLGNIFAIDAMMNRVDPDDFRRIIGTFTGGVNYIFGCHLIDIAVTLLGRPEKIIPFNYRSRNDNVADNSVTVLQYPHAVCTVRTSITEQRGFERRYINVCGERGSIVIQPIELGKGANMSSGRLMLTLETGTQEISLPPPRGRYDDQLLEFAKIVRCETENPWPFSHELLVHECVLKASGLEPN